MRKIDFFILFQFAVILFYAGCKEDRPLDPSYDSISKVEPNLTYENYLELLSNESTSYNANDLVEFLSHYGNCVQNITPAFNNYHQDIGLGGSFLGHISQVDGTLFVGPSGNILIDTTDYKFNWYVNSQLVFTGVNPTVSNVFTCSGVFRMKLEITTPIKAVFEREEWAFLGSNTGIIDCPCNNCPNQFQVFYEFYPNVPPLFFMTSHPKWDLNRDGCINVGDLTIFLANYGV